MAKTSQSGQGKSSAVPLDKKTFDRLAEPKRFSDALRRFRAKDARGLGIGRETLAGLRSSDVGRDTKL
ncbi:MAG TPA: hypothetical protein VK755_05065 [Candidatus Acidoferrales bacterium]|jgi:hypothetical protein|nr:hypothetical protein [Candidatus Acidoferrales bacterium]